MDNKGYIKEPSLTSLKIVSLFSFFLDFFTHKPLKVKIILVHVLYDFELRVPFLLSLGFANPIWIKIVTQCSTF